MLVSKDAKLLPIGNGVLTPRRLIGFGLAVAWGRLALQPRVDSVATDVEDLTRFRLLHPIEFDRLNDFTAAVVTVSIRHEQYLHKRHSNLIYCPDYVGYCYNSTIRLNKIIETLND